MLIDKDLTVFHPSTLSALKASWLAFMASVKKTFLHTVILTVFWGRVFSRAVAKISSCWICNKQVGNWTARTFFWSYFPMKVPVARVHAHKSQGKPPAQPPTLDSSSGSVFIASTKQKVRLQALRGLTMMMMMTMMIVMVTIRMTGIVIYTQ